MSRLGGTLMEATVDTVESQRFDVFSVTQMAPHTFLIGVAGVDFIRIPAHSVSEVHRHNSSDSVILIVEGEAIVIVDDREIEVRPGVRLVLPRKSFHGFRTLSEPLTFVSVQVPPILDPERNVFDREVRPV